MIFFLYGPDAYRREQKKKEIESEFRKKYSGLNLRNFDLIEEGAFSDLKEFLKNQSIFEEKKLAMIDGVFSKRDEDAGIGDLADELKRFVDFTDITLVISAEKDPPKNFEFLARKPVRSQKFDYLTGSDWKIFVRNEAKKNGVNLDIAALNILSRIYSSNTWGLTTELLKLGSLGKNVITPKDLENFDSDLSENYWAVFWSLKSRDSKNRLMALERLFLKGEPPKKIWNILASGWREKLAEMAEYDLKIKSGKLDYEEVLVDLTI